jgi:tetratricopeptide (TPR) repeat protein
MDTNPTTNAQAHDPSENIGNTGESAGSATNASADFDSLLRAANAAQVSGDRAAAYELFTRASELDPNRVEGWRGRGQTTPMDDDALLSFGFAYALTPNDRALAQSFRQRVQARAASATLQDAPILVVLGEELAQVGLMTEAHILLTSAVSLDDTNGDALLWQAATSSDPKATATTLRHVLALNPRDARARAGLDAVTQELRTIATGGTQANAESDRVNALMNEAEAALTSGDRPRAHELFVKATELAPKNEQAWLRRAASADDTEEALECYDRALAIQPDNFQAREARTFLRVRKLRDGVRNEPESAVKPAPTAAFAGGAPFADAPNEGVRQRRLLLLGIMILVLLLVLVLFFLRV